MTSLPSNNIGRKGSSKVPFPGPVEGAGVSVEFGVTTTGVNVFVGSTVAVKALTTVVAVGLAAGVAGLVHAEMMNILKISMAAIFFMFPPILIVKLGFVYYKSFI